MRIFIFSMLEEGLMCWNCHGASSGEFQREMKDLLRMFKLVMLILLEPKVSRSINSDVCEALGFERWERSDADGFIGGKDSVE